MADSPEDLALLTVKSFFNRGGATQRLDSQALQEIARSINSCMDRKMARSVRIKCEGCGDDNVLKFRKISSKSGDRTYTVCYDCACEWYDGGSTDLTVIGLRVRTRREEKVG